MDNQPVVAPVTEVSPAAVWETTVIAFFGLFFVAFDATMPNVSLPVVLKALHMSVAFGGVALTVSFIGTCVMFFLSGTLLDRWGRKKTFLLVLLGTAVFSGLTALVQDKWQWMFIRFFAGTSLALIGIVAVLLSEVAQAVRRGMMIGLVQAAYPAGSIVASTVASHFLSQGQWRLLFLLAFVPALIVIAVGMRVLREPPRFAIVSEVKKGLRAETDQSVRALVDASKARQMEWRQIFAPDLRRQSVVLSAYSFLTGFGTSVLVAFSVIFLTLYDHLPVGVAALALAAESLATLVGQFGSGWLADFFSSRNVLGVFALVGGAGIFLLAIRGSPAWVLLPMVVGGLFGQGQLGCTPRYASDSFPTRARGSGTQLVSGFHFLASIFTGSIYGLLLASHRLTWVPILGGSVMVVAGIIVFLGKNIPPRRELEEIAI